MCLLLVPDQFQALLTRNLVRLWTEQNALSPLPETIRPMLTVKAGPVGCNREQRSSKHDIEIAKGLCPSHPKVKNTCKRREKRTIGTF